MTPVVLFLPLRIVRSTNQREHWSSRSARAADHRGTVRMALGVRAAAPRALLLEEGHRRRLLVETKSVFVEMLQPIVRVTLMRLYVNRAHALDVHDGLPPAFKSVADGVTDALCSCRGCSNCDRGRHRQCGKPECLDDSDGRLEWVYAQTVSSTWGARIEIAERERR